MARLNSLLLLALADLDRRSADAAVTVVSGLDKRVVHVVLGELVAVDSNVRAERLGDMLAGEGRLDPVLIEPVAAEAARQKKLIGDQLVTDGLLTPADLEAALERQVELRFASALCMPGAVSIGPRREVKPAAAAPLGSAVLTAFRNRVGLDAIEFHLEDPDREAITLNVASPSFMRLELGPAELRVCKRLGGGEGLTAIIDSGVPQGPAKRLAGALNALRLWG